MVISLLFFLLANALDVSHFQDVVLSRHAEAISDPFVGMLFFEGLEKLDFGGAQEPPERSLCNSQ
jgi:hypothetical protein